MRREVALFLLNAVLFPGGLLPLRVFEQRYMRMTTACLRDNKSFGVCLISEGAEVGAPAVPEPVGCLARIVQWDMPQLGVLSIMTRGERRFRILERHLEADGLARANVELLPEEDDAEVPIEHSVCARLLKAIIDEAGVTQIEMPFRFESSSWVSARLAEILPLPLASRQRLLEIDDSRQRLEILYQILARQKSLSPG